MGTLNSRPMASSGLTEEQLQELRDGFNSVDEDGGGTLSHDEVHRFLTQLGQTCTMEEVKAMIKEVDTDGNGEIDFDEFTILMQKALENVDPEEELKWAFSLFNSSGSGAITPEELMDTFMAELGEAVSTDEAKAMLEAADADGDGHVSLEDFISLVQL